MAACDGRGEAAMLIIDMTHPLDRLYAMIVSRRDADPASSYPARLLAAGPHKCAKKLGEEAVEAALAAVDGTKLDLVNESADLLYHLLVVWAARGVPPEEVYDALQGREGTSGLDEKAKRAT